jgi:MFS family permease
MVLLAMIIPVLLGNFYQATTFSQTQGISELRMRAVAAGILLFILNMIGLGLGPQFVGIVSDLLSDRYGQESLRYALLICSLVNLWAAVHYFIAGRHLKDDLITEG